MTTSPTERPAFKRPIVIGMSAIVAVLGGFLVYDIARSDGPDDVAWNVCQMRVESEARYGGIEFGDHEVNEVGGAYWIEGDVDLQNGYGATVPHTFTCRIDPGGSALDDTVVVRPR